MIGRPCSVVAIVHEFERQARVRGLDVISRLDWLDRQAAACGVKAEEFHVALARYSFPDAAEVWFVGRIEWWLSIAEVHYRRNRNQ